MNPIHTVFLIVAMVLHFQPATASAQQLTGKATIEGIVIQHSAGEAIAGVRVNLISESDLGGRASALFQSYSSIPSMTTLTDKSGRFSLLDIAPGSYRLTFSRSGYVRQELGPSIIPGQGVKISLAADQAMRDVIVKLTPTGSVSGTVRDVSGKPLVGAEVQLMRFAYDEIGQKSMQVAFSDRTNDRGEYRMYYVTPGRYLLNAGKSAPSGQATGESPNEVAELYTTAYYPGGGADPTKAASLEIRPGSEIEGIHFTLDRLRLYSIRGRVVDSVTGKPPASADFGLTMQSTTDGFGPLAGGAASPSRNIYNAVSGTFEIRNIPPGLYGLVVRQTADSNAFVPVRVVDSDVEDTLVTLTPYILLSGQLRVEGQELPSRPRIQLHTSWNGAPITITNVYTLTMAQQTDGTLSHESVRRVEYRLTVLGLPPGFYVKQARLGETDLLLQPFNLVSDTAGLNILLASDSGQIDGIVAGESTQLEVGTQVALIPASLRDRTDLYKSAITGTDGRFSIAGIPPGDYKLFAWQAIEPFSWFDPDTLKVSEGKATTVHVSPSSAQTISLKAIPSP